MNRREIIIRLFYLSILTFPVVGQTVIEYTPFDSPTAYEETITTLKDFLHYHGKHRTNTFYVAKLKEEPTQKNSAEYLYAYWPTAKSILLLGHFVPAAKTDKYDWVSRKAVINLRTDVVPTKKEVLSSFHVDKTWVDYIINGCKKGRKIVLTKK